MVLYNKFRLQIPGEKAVARRRNSAIAIVSSTTQPKILVEWDVQAYKKFTSISEYLKARSQNYFLVAQILFVRFVILAVSVSICAFMYLYYVQPVYSQDMRELT